MIIKGVAASSAIDSSGEILSVEGADISDMLQGKCYLNYEHNSAADDMVGIVTYAKKLYKEEDCENDDQKLAWNKTLLPMIYFEGRLFDKEGHVGAICVASIIRSFIANGEPIAVGTSVEGATMERGKGDENHLLLKTCVRRLSVTMRPCNKQAMIYSVIDENPDILKSEAFIDYSDFFNAPAPPHGFIEIEDPIADIMETIAELNKTLTAGMANVAPSQMVQGAALAKETIIGPPSASRLKAAYKKWDRKKPLKMHMKAELPDVSDEYIDTFEKLANDLEIKKTEGMIRIQPDEDSAISAQNALLENTYLPANGGPSRVVANGAGQTMDILQSALTPSGGETAKQAAAYFAAAMDVFGLGDHVPATAFFMHQVGPMEGAPLHYAVAHVKGQSALVGDIFGDNVKKNKDLYQKLVLMDAIMGHGQRKYGNILIDGDKPYLLDNHHALEYSNPSALHQRIVGGDIMGDETRNWLLAIDPKKLAASLANSKIGLDRVKKALVSLKTAQGFHHHPISAILMKLSGQPEETLL